VSEKRRRDEEHTETHRQTRTEIVLLPVSPSKSRAAMNTPTSLKLTKRQMALVDVMVAEGLTTSKAATKAGYAEGKSGYVTASKTLKLPHVQQYMMQRISEQLGLNAVAAAAKVMTLAQGAKSEYVQLEAAKDILDRAGFKPIDRSQVQIAGDIKVSIDLG